MSRRCWKRSRSEPKVRPSPEFLSVSRRWPDAAVSGQSKLLQNLLSSKPHLCFIGTASGERYEGQDVREGIGGFFGIVPEGSWHEEVFGQAFEAGDVGWSCFEHRVCIMGTAEAAEVRTTLVFVLEDGAWKIVQRHGSVPVPNADAFAMEQVSMTDLVTAARNSYVQDQTEGLASIVFTDIVGSAQLAEVLGDRLWSRTVEDHFALLRGIIGEAGGQMVKSLGDGTLSRFSSARKALRAATAIQAAMSADTDGPKTALRIGIHTGDVVQSQGDFFGTVVNKAARLMALAGPGEIAVSEATRTMMSEEAEFAFGGPEEVALKGFDGAQRLYRLIWNG